MKNFKKVISAVIALAMFASSIATVGASKYTDVADTAAYAEAVEVLTALGIVTGYEENGTYTFKPEGTITRAEAATMIVGALNMTEDAKASAGTSQFADVNTQAAWAAGYVNVGVAQGFIKGMDATTFAPQENVTYAQMCVMLTSIAGYGEYAAASTTDTWSSGYTSMAAATGINKGVSVADSTPLTRGQVAQMIYNTLVTPMLGVAEYSLAGNTYTQLDGKDDRSFKTLLSDKFNGYVATITITATPLTDDDLKNDEVRFDITKADWWEEEAVTSKNADEYEDIETYVAAGVDVNSNLLQSGKAVIVTDDNDDKVMKYFAANGKTITKEFAADEYNMQEDLGVKNRYYKNSDEDKNVKIRVGGTAYKMADAITIYANGSEFATISATTNGTADEPNANQVNLDKLLGSAQGTIKFVRPADEDYYTAIFIDYYQVAEVISVEYKNNETILDIRTLAPYSDDEDFDKISISDEALEEGNTIVAVKRNGSEAELSSIVKGDIIAYAFDFGMDATSGDVEDPRVIDIIATNETISGKVSTASDEDRTITVDGKAYKTVNYEDFDTEAMLSNTYEFVLDPFGRLFDKELAGVSEKYAIATKTTSTGIQLVLADGTVKSYELSSKAKREANEQVEEDITEYLKTAAIEDRVVAYSLKASTSTITSLEFITGADLITFENEEYKSKSGKLGGIKISSSTQVIDAQDAAEEGAYIYDSTNYGAYANSNFTDGTKYSGFGIKVGTITTFAVLTSIGSAFGEESRFAVVKKEAQYKETDDGDEYDVVVVLYEGEEKELNFVKDVYEDEGLDLGDVFFFETDSDGLVDTVYIVYDESTETFNGIDEIPSDKLSGLGNANDPDGWRTDLGDSLVAPIQLVEGYVVSVSSSEIALAGIDAIEVNDALDSTIDYVADDAETEDVNEEDGVATFTIDTACVAYEYDVNNDNFNSISKKLSALSTAASVKASNFSKFEGDEKGVYDQGTGMVDYANYAVAMVVDGDVVAIFTIRK